MEVNQGIVDVTEVANNDVTSLLATGKIEGDNFSLNHAAVTGFAKCQKLENSGELRANNVDLYDQSREQLEKRYGQDYQGVVDAWNTWRSEHPKESI